jgi:hypothetical protein
LRVRTAATAGPANTRGLCALYWSPTYAYVAAADEPGRPSEADIMKALAIADIVEAAIAEAQKEAGAQAQRAIESYPAWSDEPPPAPPPHDHYDGADDDIVF